MVMVIKENKLPHSPHKLYPYNVLIKVNNAAGKSLPFIRYATLRAYSVILESCFEYISAI